MGAPTAPVEEQQEPVEEPVAEPEVESPPVEEGGDPEAEETVDLSEVLKGLSAAQLKAVLESAPQEAREEIESEIEKRGEQRARTRTQERTTASTARQQAFAQQKALGESAAAWLEQAAAAAANGDMIDANTLRRARHDLKAAGVAENALAIEAEISPLLDKYLPDLTPEEQTKLDKPLYEDARTGGVSHLPVLIELALERAKAQGVEEGIKKGEGNKKAREELIDKLQNATKIKKQSAGVVPNGRAANPSDVRQQIVDEINAIDPFKDPNAQDKLDALKYKLRGL